MYFKSENLLQALEKYASCVVWEQRIMCDRPLITCFVSTAASIALNSRKLIRQENIVIMSMIENCVTWKSRNLHSSVCISAASLRLSERSWRSVVTRERHREDREKHVLAWREYVLFSVFRACERTAQACFCDTRSPLRSRSSDFLPLRCAHILTDVSDARDVHISSTYLQ